MKNKTVNKKVLRAMSIGLAAMMTVQPILATPVFADDTEPVDDSNTTTYDEEKHESDTTNDARKAVDTASKSANTVVKDAEAVQNDIKTDIPVIDQETGEVLNQASLDPEALEKVPKALEEVGDTLKVVDADLTIVENYLTDEKKITGSGFNEAYNANVQAYVAAVAVYGENGPAMPTKPEEGAEDYDAALKAYNDALNAYNDFQALKAEIDKRLNAEDWNTNNVLKPAIEGVTDENFVSETEANAKIAAAVGEVNKAFEVAATEQEKAVVAGEEAADFIGKTEEQFNNYVDEIKNASTIDAANKSYDKLVERLNDAKTTLEEKQKVYDDAVKAYNDYKTKYDNQKAAIAKAETAYNDAKKIYEDAAKKYDEFSDKHEQKVKDLTIYHDTLKAAEENYNAAVEQLGKIKEQSDQIAAAAAAAKASILANGGNSILAAIKVTEDSTGRVWSEQDTLFEEIVKNYYVPEILKGKDANLEWKRISEDMCNYCVVTYTDKDGNEQTLVLDYVMTNEDENGTLKETTDENPGKLNGNSTSKIVIFEKSEDERKAADALDKDKNALLYDDKDINVDKYKVINEKGQTVYLNKSYVEGELAKKDGSIINVSGVYYQKGDATTDVKLKYGENGLVSDTTVDDTRTVITVDEDTVKAEDLKLEDGKFVQEYKGDTTTIVYHKELSQSGYDYDSEKAALDDAKKAVGEEDELISAETVDVTHEEHTTSGTYIPIFQETITISKDVKTWDADFAIAEKRISVYNGLNNTKTNIKKDGYFILDENWSDITANTKEKDRLTKEENYTVSQTATFTYVSSSLIKTGTEKDFVFADLFNFSSSEEAQKAVANELKSQGKILISWKSFDLNPGKATYKYIDTVQVSGETCDKIDDAKASFNSKANVKGRDGATLLGSYTDLRGNKIDLVNSSTDSKVVTKYAYKLSYWDQTSKTTENTLIKTETSDASKVYGVVVQNQDGATVLNQVKDEKFNEFIENVKAQKARFEKLEADAKKAQEDVIAAQEKVKALEEAIKNIKGTIIKGNGNQVVKPVNKLEILALLGDVKLSGYTLDELKAFLETAQGQLDDAKARLAKLNEQLADAEEARDNRITELTPAPAPAPTTGGGETTPAGGGTTTAPISTLATALAGAPTFALPTGGVAAPAAGVAGARTSRGAAIDSDSSAAGTEDTTAKIAPTKEVEEDALAITKDTIKTIKDNETPLSSLTEDSTQKMNWWWLLLIALLGATGEEIYRRNKKKKEEEAALKAEVDKNN